MTWGDEKDSSNCHKGFEWDFILLINSTVYKGFGTWSWLFENFAFIYLLLVKYIVAYFYSFVFLSTATVSSACRDITH